VQKIGVRTENFQLAYRVMHLLRERKIDVEQYSINEPLPHQDSIWIATPQEVAGRSNEGRPIAAQLESIDEMIEEAIFALRSPQQTYRLILGIDTGPRPGLAWLADGVLIDTVQTESIDECLARIDALLQHQSFQHLLIRLGNGSPSHRDQLVNSLLAKGHCVELVKENKTSRGLNRQQHGVAAVRIATSSGHKVWEMTEINPSDGELRDIQRMSRKKSNGRVTIPTDLARKVARGEVTIEQAIEEII
tara:strand:- start:15 stop:758 length:744 start_codon:yes stop_codon:yes gene_type:complete